MSDDTHCRHCAELISPMAKTCPKCGHPQSLFAQPVGTYGSYIICLLISFALIHFSNMLGANLHWSIAFLLAMLLQLAWHGIHKEMVGNARPEKKDQPHS